MNMNVIAARILSLWILLGIACGAVLVHGYHPNAEDAAIYLPGVEKRLYPDLFPYNQQFFSSHARFTLFPQLVAESVRLTHLSLYSGLLLWHFASIFLLLFACYRLAATCANSSFGCWAAVGLVAALLTLPVAGTALYIMDQYVNPRNLCAFTGVLGLALLLKGKYLGAASCLFLGLIIHPFMAFFAILFCGTVLFTQWMDNTRKDLPGLSLTFLMPLGFLYPTPSPAYHQVALSHPYHYLLRWEWYEWLGAIGPLGIFWVCGRVSRAQGRRNLQWLCQAASLFGVLSLIAALVLAIPSRLEVLARIQPLRSFYLLYILLLLLAGIFIGERVLKAHLWRWILLFLPLCAGMFLAQRSLFPESAHIEWPGVVPRNPWAQAFEWSRENTPTDAIFALDPYHMRIRGEDANGFRAIARRSMLADAVKDSGAASMFPPLADEWLRQVNAQKNWKSFRIDDYRRLQTDFGVNWVVLETPLRTELECPYENRAVAVCRLNSHSLFDQQSRR
jgi:hypothetical protein